MAKPALKEAKAPEKPQADAANGEGGAKPKKGKKLLLIVAGLVVLLAGGGGAAWYFLREAPDGQAKHAAPKPPVFVTLEPFTVNLQPDEGDQYLQVGLTLKMADAAAVDFVKLHMPEARNRILLLLSSKHGSELVTVQGKQKLADEIMAQVRQPFAPGGAEASVSGVLFTSFVIQ